MSVRPIILAEDNDKLRRLYSDRLSADGFTVLKAEDGEKAVSLLHKVVNPQIIILDVMMPRIDGIEACRRMRNMQGLRPCPLIFLTSLDTPQTMLDCLRAGGDDFVMKSTSLDEIVERVNYWIRRGASEENAERRLKAIRELEAITAGEKPGRVDALDGVKLDDESFAVSELADFVVRRQADFINDLDPLLRFGYLVGLFEGYTPKALQNRKAFDRGLRNLVFKTAFLDPREIDSLLGNYQRILPQRQFKNGWEKGQSDALQLTLPAAGSMPHSEGLATP
jgi:DNA-binding response OmpR family regulator